MVLMMIHADGCLTDCSFCLNNFLACAFILDQCVAIEARSIHTCKKRAKYCDIKAFTGARPCDCETAAGGRLAVVGNRQCITYGTSY
jgi:hypothetical protein